MQCGLPAPKLPANGAPAAAGAPNPPAAAGAPNPPAAGAPNPPAAAGAPNPPNAAGAASAATKGIESRETADEDLRGKTRQN